MSTQSKHPRQRLARKIAIDLAVMTVIGTILALIGPFGSFEQPLPIRLATWLAFSYLGYAIYSPMSWVVEKAHQALDLPKLGLWVAACLVATIPMSIIVWSVSYVPGPVPLPSAETALTQYLYVFVIGGGVTALFNLIDTKQDTAEPATLPPAAEDAAPIPLSRNDEPDLPQLVRDLPPQLGSDVVALEMEDHYVRVHTALGSELVLMRMRDAVAQLAEFDGMQVHRSWWVARAAVEDVRREGRNVRLVLPGEREAPVARAQVAELRQAGWI